VKTVVSVRFTVITIAAMLALGYVTRIAVWMRRWDWRLHGRARCIHSSAH